MVKVSLVWCYCINSELFYLINKLAREGEEHQSENNSLFQNTTKHDFSSRRGALTQRNKYNYGQCRNNGYTSLNLVIIRIGITL